MAYSKQTWDTTSYVTPTRMNHIEDGIDSVADIGDALNDTDTYTVPTSPTDYGTFLFTKIGKVVYCYVENVKNIQTGAYRTIATLPAKFRPSHTWRFLLFANGSTADYTLRMQITSNGYVQLYNYSSTTGTMNVADTVSYPLV